MSINLAWRQVDPKAWTDLHTFTPSGDRDTLERAFRSLPIVLTRAEIDVLSGMSAAKGVNEAEGRGRNIFDDLIDAINKYGAIEVKVFA